MADENLRKYANLFFPDNSYLVEDFDAAVDNGDILIDPEKIVNLLKSSLLDEAILEVELDDLTRVFFCRVLDQAPELEEKVVDGVVTLVEPEYTKADYLVEQGHVTISPLEPSIGNFLICSTHKLLLRILSSKCAFELGCFYSQKTRVRGMPVLQCSFPLVARQVKGARAYRAKIPKNMELFVHVERKGKRKSFDSCPIDLSVEGMLIVDSLGKYTDLKEEEKLLLEVYWPKGMRLQVSARVIHVSQLRNKEGIQYCCGIQFDLATRALAKDVEQLVSGVQRQRLRELSDISDKYGVDFVNW